MTRFNRTQSSYYIRNVRRDAAYETNMLSGQQEVNVAGSTNASRSLSDSAEYNAANTRSSTATIAGYQSIQNVIANSTTSSRNNLKRWLNGNTVGSSVNTIIPGVQFYDSLNGYNTDTRTSYEIPGYSYNGNPGQTYTTFSNTYVDPYGNSYNPGELYTPGRGNTTVTPSYNPAFERVRQSGLPDGADNNLRPTMYEVSLPDIGAGSDDRVRIKDPSGKLLSTTTPLTSKINETGGVIFPYTPQVQFSHKAVYDNQSLVHTNYQNPMYQYSTVEAITITGNFTAQTKEHAKYVAGMIQFFRAATKMFYGQDSNAGTPPVVCKLMGIGTAILPEVPVVITDFNYTFPDNVDYISTEGTGVAAGIMYARIPALMTVTVTCKPVYSRNSIDNQFSLTNFATGSNNAQGFI